MKMKLFGKINSKKGLDVLDLEKDDYVQVYAAHNQGASQAMTDDYNFFMGYKLIG